ncbi:MAG: 30S ribosomal protein S17 [Blastocatellia bacterium]
MEENIENNPTENGGENQELLTDAAAGGTDAETAEAVTSAAGAPKRRRQEKVGLVTSDKMTKTVVVRVERQVRHPKYKRYIRKRSKFMAHDEIGAHTGDIVRIIETRPLSARKRWRVIEIVQKAR